MDFIERSKNDVRALAEARGHRMSRYWHGGSSQFSARCLACGRKVFVTAWKKKWLTADWLLKGKRDNYYGTALETDCTGYSLLGAIDEEKEA